MRVLREKLRPGDATRMCEGGERVFCDFGFEGEDTDGFMGRLDGVGSISESTSRKNKLPSSSSISERLRPRIARLKRSSPSLLSLPSSQHV